MTSANATPPTVTLCGSTRFRAEFADVNRQLTLAGALVFAPGVFAHTGDEITDAQKASLDALHLEKIRRADVVLVVDPTGYYGDSTRREIGYATELGRPVRFLSDMPAAPAPVDRAGRRYVGCVWGALVALVVLGVLAALAVPAFTGYVLLSWVVGALLVSTGAGRRGTAHLSSKHDVSVITQLLSSISADSAATVHGEDGR